MKLAHVAALLLFAVAPIAMADDATQVPQQVTEALQSDIRAHRAQYESDHEALYARATEIVRPSLNARLASELALGKQWRRASHAERDQLEAAMAQALVRIYALALLEQDTDRRLDWNRSRMKALDGTTAVYASAPGEWPTPALLLFAMRRDGEDHWQIYDVSYKGTSVIDGLRRRGERLPQLLEAAHRSG
ncbi:MAG TPA: ABC transporter substrate-binding protein [Nevskiaceae bacterium]|nr:ABC transporter substrate-binding protein [Nevskiaceae bacterium]